MLPPVRPCRPHSRLIPPGLLRVPLPPRNAKSGLQGFAPTGSPGLVGLGCGLVVCLGSLGFHLPAGTRYAAFSICWAARSPSSAVTTGVTVKSKTSDQGTIADSTGSALSASAIVITAYSPPWGQYSATTRRPSG